MNGNLFGPLVLTAMVVGALHSLAPDHWVPFAAVARARGWGAARTARVTLLCGFGHVTVSALFGLLALFLGREVVEAMGARLESVAGLLLIGFGLAYGIWGIRKGIAAKLHGHTHSHYDHVHDPGRVSAVSLFLIFAADPCVAVIPIMMAASPLGAGRVTLLVVLYELTTLGAMVALVLPARAGIAVFKSTWIDRFGDAAAGGVIAATGVFVALVGW
jgi:hypothetical protein